MTSPTDPTISTRADDLSDLQILHIFVEIYAAKGTRDARGDFLTIYAEAVARADDEKFQMLRGASVMLIAKYGLTSYLANYEASA